MDKVINSYHPFENQKHGQDISLKEKEILVPPPEQVKETKVKWCVFHIDKRKDKTKFKSPKHNVILQRHFF